MANITRATCDSPIALLHVRIQIDGSTKYIPPQNAHKIEAVDAELESVIIFCDSQYNK